MMGDSQTQFTICNEHNLPLDVFINPDKASFQQKQVCRQCYDIFYGIVPEQLVKDPNKELIHVIENQAESNLKQMKLIIQSLNSIRNALNKQIESLINELKDQISYQDGILKQCNDSVLQQETIKQIHEKYINNLIIFQNKATKEIQILQQKYSFNQNIKLLEEINLSTLSEQISLKKIRIEENQQPPVQIILQNNQIKPKRFEYQLLPKPTIYDDRIKGIAFNEDTSVVVAIFSSFIKVYKFQNEKLKQIQRIENHCLADFIKFMKKDNQFIIKAQFGSFMIWQQKKDQQWIFTDQINANGEVNCLIVNSNSDQIIFAKRIEAMNPYSIIIFCKLNNNNKWEQYQQIETSDCVYSLSLNDSNTKLISAQRCSKIQVYEYDESEWYLVQLINIKDWGEKLCFISESEFIFLPFCSENLHLYSFNNQIKKFEKVNQFQIQGGGGKYDDVRFSIQFIKSINLLLVQNCNFINILRKEESMFILDQSIEFKNYNMVGCISEDGQYLLTQDEDSNELLVRKLSMIQQ